MKNLYFEATRNTPRISFDAGGVLEISGRSIPENALPFFNPVLSWLDTFMLAPPASIVMKVRLEYYNTSTSKHLLDLFRKLEAVHKLGGNVRIEWYYDKDDEDMLEAGDDYGSILNVPFAFIENT